MRITQLLSTTAAIVLIGGGIAAAQGMKTDDQPARAPSAQQHAPAEKVAPPIARHPAKAAETTGQGGAMSPNAEQHQGGATPNAAGAEHHERGMKSEAAEKGAKTGEKSSEKTEKSEMKGAAAGQKSETKSAAGKADKAETRSTTGQGAAGAAKLSSEQRTKITTIIRRHKVSPVHLNVSISVGARIPERVHLYPLPVEVVDVYPEWRGYDYILVGDEILVIDPRNHEIVAILEA